jgi:hypothetical protein
MKAIPLPELSFVMVNWKDSNYAPGWNNKHRMTASIPSVRSAGWVTYSDKDILELTGHIGDEGAKLNPTSIPWRSIVSMRKLEAF